MAITPVPGALWGSYPQRLNAAMPVRRAWGARAYHRQAHAAARALPGWRALSAPAFAQAIHRLRARLGLDGLVEPHITESLAAVSEAVRRSLGLQLHHGQLQAAAAILDNRLAEMATGEGKTLAALLAAATGALAGVPVHVLTANEHLVQRDAERMQPVCALLGLSLGHVVGSMDEAQRRRAYACAITYTTAPALVFDYLRDHLQQEGLRDELARHAQALGGGGGEPLLRGLCMAVIDEADSLLIDEARMPLVLSQQQDDAATHGFLWQAYALGGQLQAERDFRLDPAHGHTHLTDAGRQRLAALCAPLGGRWLSPPVREDGVCLALQARHALQCDRHYLLRDGQVEIIDGHTGRGAPQRVWSRGLHTLVAIKEGCKPRPSTRTLAQITYQRFFPRYLRLGGMSGTLREVRHELWDIYRLSVVRVPLRTPSAREQLPPRLYASVPALWSAVAERVRALQSCGRPVLVGTGSVAESEALSVRLHAAGIAHHVLNARLDREEAATVAQAGRAGQVTVTTQMAGRGTDIPLGPGVAALGGLHVLCCQHGASRRLERQLQGRCARQGDPGSTETWLALPADAAPLLSAWAPPWLWRLVLAGQQRLSARRDRMDRRRLLQADRSWEQALSFGGQGE